MQALGEGDHIVDGRDGNNLDRKYTVLQKRVALRCLHHSNLHCLSRNHHIHPLRTPLKASMYKVFGYLCSQFTRCV